MFHVRLACMSSSQILFDCSDYLFFLPPALAFLLSRSDVSLGLVPFAVATPLTLLPLSPPSFSTSARPKIPCSRSFPTPVIWKIQLALST